MEMKMIRLDEITPNPLQPREAFDREKLREMGDTISEVGVLQPIVVRPKGRRYEIISGERRWKASQIAGKTEIPAIVKAVPDEEVMIQSLIENVHREDLKPIEQAKAILEVFKAQETFFFKEKVLTERIVDNRLPQKIATIRQKKSPEGYKYYRDTTLSKEEKVIDMIVKKIGLGYSAIYESLSLLKLPKEIQEEARVQRVGKAELAVISKIEDEETQKKVFRRVVDEDLSYEKTAELVSIIKKAPEPLKKAVLERQIKTEVAEKLLGVPESKMQKVIEDVKSLRLTPEEAEERAKWAQIEVPVQTQEQLEEVLKDYDKLRREMRERMESPEMKVAGRSFRNLSAHVYVSGALEHMFCPVCGADSRNLVWKCHNVSIKDAIEKLKAITQNKGGSRK